MKFASVGRIVSVSRTRGPDAMLTPDLGNRYRVVSDEIVGEGSDDLSFIPAERARDCHTHISSSKFSILISQLSECTFDRALIASP
jgi:hypothetical protein